MTSPLKTLLSGSWILAAAALHAAPLTWDPAANGSQSGGAGTWDANTTANWWNGSADQAWTDTTGIDTAIFGGTGGAVTIATGGVTANALTFNATGYALSGAALTLAGSTPTVTVTNGSESATISSVITGAAGLVKSGAGTLTLSGANTYTGGTIVSAGKLVAGSATAFGASGASVSVASGASLDLAGFATGSNVSIAGTGTDGTGALFNSSATTVGSIGTLTLTGSATIGGAVNNNTGIGIATTGINLGGNTLNLNSGRLIIDGTDAFTGGGLINVNSGGVLYFAGATAGSGAGVTISVKTGGVMDGRDYANSALASYPTVELDGGMLSNGYTNSNGGGGGVILYNPLTVTANGGILSGNASGFDNRLRLAGTLVGSGALTLQGSRGVEFRGDISGYTGTMTATAGTVAFNPTAAVQTFNGVLSGARPVEKNGANTTIFTTANNYSGTTTVNGGTLQISGAGKLGNGAAIIVNTAGTVDLGGTTQTVGAATLGGTVLNGTLNATSYSGTGGNVSANLGSAIVFTQTSGSTTLSGTNAITSTVINGGNLTFANTAASGSGTITVNAGGSLVASGMQSTVSGWLASGRVAAASVGNIALSGDSSETIDFTGFNSLGLASTGFATYSGTLTPGTGGYRFGGATSNLTIASALGGANALTKSDAGTAMLAGNNTYTGTTTVNAGTLLVTGAINGGAVTVSGGSLLVGGAATINATSGGAVNIGGGSLAARSLNAIGAAGSTITLTNGSGTLVFGGSANDTTDRVISHTAGSTMTNNGSGTVTLTNNIQVANSAIGIFWNGGGKTVMQGVTGNTSALLNFNKSGVGMLTVNGNITPNGGSIRAQGGILSFSSTASTTGNAVMTSQRTVGGVALFAAGSSIKTADANTNGIMGGWAVYNGTDWAQSNGSGNAIGAYSGYTTDTWAAGNNTDVSLAGANPASGATTNSLRFNATGVKTLTLAGTNLIISGGILVTSAVGNSLTTITGGTLTAGASNATADLIVHQNNTANALTIASAIANNGTGTTSFTKSGDGTVNFSTQKTYTGTTNVLAGVLNLSGGGGLAGVIRGTVNVAAGATLRLSTGDATGYATDATRLSVINLQGGTLNINTTGNQTLGSAVINMTGGSITGIANSNLDFFGGASAINSLASGATSVISGVNLSALRQGSSTFTVAAGYTANGIDLDIASVIQNGVSGSVTNAVITKAGAGTLALSGTNTFGGTGQSVLISAGTLMIGNGGSTGNISTQASVGVTNNSVLAFNRSDAAGVFANVVSGTGRVTQMGSGSSTLTGANTYAGGTVVSAGTLVTGNTSALGTGNVNVTAGVLRIGNGTANTVQLGSGANLVVNGTLAFANNFGVNSATANITLQGTGGYTFTNGAVLDLNNLFNIAGTYNLITGGTGTKTDAMLSFANFDSVNYSAAFSQGVLTVTAVPEPATYGLLGAGALAGVAVVRRRRKLA